MQGGYLQGGLDPGVAQLSLGVIQPVPQVGIAGPGLLHLLQGFHTLKVRAVEAAQQLRSLLLSSHQLLLGVGLLCLRRGQLSLSAAGIRLRRCRLLVGALGGRLGLSQPHLQLHCLLLG